MTRRRKVDNSVICPTKDNSENASCWAPQNASMKLTLKPCKHKRELVGGDYMSINAKINEH